MDWSLYIFWCGLQWEQWCMALGFVGYVVLMYTFFFKRFERYLDRK